MPKQFFCNEGFLAFVIPFSFTSENDNDTNKCIELFSKIKPDDDRDRYDEFKEELRDVLSSYFPDASVSFHGTTESNEIQGVVKKCHYRECHFEHTTYKGRNLCHCLSISRKFHDDRSQDIPRIEISLGTYHVCYEIKESDHFFEFYFDSLLLLSDEKGGEGGFLVFNVSLASIQENCIGTITHNRLDNFIFIKHLFYKKRLKCTINREDCQSMQEWTGEYLKTLFSALGISKDHKSDFQESSTQKARNENSVAFGYSIMELNNIVDESNTLLPLSNIKSFLRSYRNQLYGLMVSDEGWRFISPNELKHKYENNYWSSRSFSAAFFLEHNALIINQFDRLEYSSTSVPEGYCAFSQKWFSAYDQTHESDFYAEYAGLRPCIPGIASLVFYAYLKAIYKEMVLERVKELSDGNDFTDEEKYKRLAFTLQQHSMSLDAIKNIEECIYSQFGIPVELDKLRERYQREANNVQNNKVVNLTHVTACISLSALVIAALAIGLKKGGSIFSVGLNWTIVILIAALLIPLFIYIVISNNLWDRIIRKNRKSN